MLKSLIVGCGLQAALLGCANAAGPFGTIRVGNWVGGAFSNQAGAFSHCAATASYANGISLVVGRNAGGSWLPSFASPAIQLKTGESVPIDLIFDGQQQARLFGAANTSNMVTFVMPPNVARTFQKASLMAATAGGAPLQFNLTSTSPLIAAPIALPGSKLTASTRRAILRRSPQSLSRQPKPPPIRRRPASPSGPRMSPARGSWSAPMGTS